MEKYEDFIERNASFDGGICYKDFLSNYSEKIMRRNYAIAEEVEKTYNETHCKTDEPQIGDIVEFSDGFNVYKHASIVENLYGGSKYGMFCVCENGSSFTDGKSFSTSGGAFSAFHKSRFQFVGEAENIVWTWGCHGSGANQGIYFPLKVRKWIIPYEPTQIISSRVYIRGKNAKDWRGNPIDAVWIENSGEFFHAESFVSVKAFLAWAEYVGYKSYTDGNGTFCRISSQKIVRKYFLNENDAPIGKPIKVLHNGMITDAIVTNENGVITYHIYNNKFIRYGTKEYEENQILRRKFYGNPLGV